MRRVLDRHGLTDDVRPPAESPLPIAVREHDRLLGARLVVTTLEKAADDRGRTEHWKQLLRDSEPAYALRGANTCHRENIRGTAGPGTYLLECGQMLLPVGKLREPVRTDHGLTSV